MLQLSTLNIGKTSLTANMASHRTKPSTNILLVAHKNWQAQIVLEIVSSLKGNQNQDDITMPPVSHSSTPDTIPGLLEYRSSDNAYMPYFILDVIGNNILHYNCLMIPSKDSLPPALSSQHQKAPPHWLHAIFHGEEHCHIQTDLCHDSCI